MATATKVYLTPEHSGLVKSQSPTTESAVKASELLQKNHDHHHTFYNADGYHNHIAHQLLSLYGLGAPADVLEKQYELNASYQRPLPKLEENIVDDMSDPVNFKKYLGNEKYYHDFLRFFEREIGKKGWENVVNEYMFAADERAEDMLIRMYAGFLHPLIHLGFGIEFKQPAIVAEALAQTAVHAPAIGNLLIPAEKAASANSTSKKTLPELLDEIRANKKLSTAAHWNDPNKVYNGILVRAPQEMINICSQWSASENNLEEKTAEMINAAIYFTAGAQHPPKQVKFDFYFMHCVNASIFFPTFNAQPWLSTASKVRLLNFKVWLDLAMYASRRSPEPLLEEITMYVPKDFEAGGGEWPGIFKRLFALEDDGHAIKLARAVRNAEIVSHGFGDEKVDRIKGFMFEKIGNMVVDSVEDSGSHWVRSAGFDEAWVNFVDRRRSVHL